MYLAEVLNLF